MELPDDPPADLRKCDAEPPMPDPATLPTNDARPYVVPLVDGVYAGRDCRSVVAGWNAWWSCMKAAAASPNAAPCDGLAEILKALKASRPPDASPDPRSTPAS